MIIDTADIERIMSVFALFDTPLNQACGPKRVVRADYQQRVPVVELT